jgi:hypothetical protein
VNQDVKNTSNIHLRKNLQEKDNDPGAPKNLNDIQNLKEEPPKYISESPLHSQKHVTGAQDQKLNQLEPIFS